MDVLRTIEVFLLDPERATDAAVIRHPVPERPVVGLVRIADPGVPPGKFALSCDMQVRAVQEGSFGDVVHGKGGLFLQTKALKSDPSAMCKCGELTLRPQSSGQREKPP